MEEGLSRRRIMRSGAAAALLSVVGMPLMASARPGGVPGRPKVGICHRTRSGRWMYKLVSNASIVAHRLHGDIVDGVTGPEFCAAQPPAPRPHKD